MAQDPTAEPIALRAFRALCETRALRWKLGFIPAEHGNDDWIGFAVDPLPRWALNHGLDTDLAQQIIAEAFEPAAKKEEPMTDQPPEWTEAAKAWREERDRDDPISRKPSLPPPPQRCPHCDPGPCQFPTLCAGAEQADEWWATIPDKHPLREGPLGNLPKGWRHMGESELWHRLQRAHETQRLARLAAERAHASPDPETDALIAEILRKRGP